MVRTQAGTFVFEFKYDRSAAEALAQISEKDYALPFSRDGGKLWKAAVNYSSAERTIDEWIIEEA